MLYMSRIFTSQRQFVYSQNPTGSRDGVSGGKVKNALKWCVDIYYWIHRESIPQWCCRAIWRETNTRT